ncbi:DUF4430 domain-containing protein, partial [Bradyrhizobium japonicum]|uniref:DUF4430 domain-containing protein n=1 Tax=Bradyrhizobium japonicum TaxID=375 RepID=UPI001269E125
QAGQQPAQGTGKSGLVDTMPQLEKAPEKPYVRLWVTRDFGTKTMQETVVPIEPNDTVMDVLKRSVGEVKTSYGGGFVDSIDGLSTGYKSGDANSKKLDWFYYVNGQIAEVGAAETPVHSGDVVWWDYHNWEYAVHTPALVGAFPHPFVKHDDQVQNTPIIMAIPGFEQQAEELADSLRQVRTEQIKPIPFDEMMFQKEKPVLLVGDVKSLSTSAFLQKLWHEKNTLGLFAEFAQEGIHTYDDNGKMVKTYSNPGAGVVISTLHPDTHQPIWMISGTDKAGVEKGVQAVGVTKDWQNELPLRHFFGLIIDGEQKINLPVIQSNGAKQ